jgi:subtilase family serine protease
MTGKHTISIVLDSTKVVPEADETNNWARLVVTIKNNVVTNGQFTGP